ncbi:MAG: ribonuclease Z [Candidatus Aenigmarchaeota archaeon]|nr:ribonuclease Z [Candidatus Aenigmarchaeota archaeon]
MRVVFLGVGESTGTEPNTSLLVESSMNILLDCGPTVPQQLWRYNSEPDFLDAVYLTHLHGDHVLGVPLLLLRMWQDNRKRKLTIIGQHAMWEFLQHLVETVYPKIMKAPKFEIAFLDLPPAFGKLKLAFAKTSHSMKNYAIRVSEGTTHLCYSGDGAPSADSRALYKNAALLVHEAYTLRQEGDNHASVDGVLQLAEEAKAKSLALVHLHRSVPQDAVQETAKRSRMKILVPKPMESVEL